MKTQIILMACGCFNPTTNMHLRLFEVARDHLRRIGYDVIGGIISPVHDGYGKKQLEPAIHRLKMVELALETNDWVKLSDWEAKQESWSRTRKVLQYHQNVVNSYLHSSADNQCNNVDQNNADIFKWLPNSIKNRSSGKKAVVKLLCGADLLESFGTPGLWADEDIEAIVGEHGLVVITRSNANPNEFIYNSDVLTRLMRNIVIVIEWIINEISSTKIRTALRRSESVKYLIPNNVIQYIHEHNLYGCDQTKYLTANVFDSAYHTPSPSDPLIDSPSPTSCLYICNNNLFNNNGSIKYDKISIDSFKSHTFKHPGQAVKILMDDNGEHTVVQDIDDIKKEVCDGIDSECKTRELPENAAASCNKIDETLEQHNSNNKNNTSLNECRSCDENLIKLIFTRHGIEVLSDVETMV